jgi:hypothetical protein
VGLCRREGNRPIEEAYARELAAQQGIFDRIFAAPDPVREAAALIAEGSPIDSFDEHERDTLDQAAREMEEATYRSREAEKVPQDLEPQVPGT